MQKNNNNSKVEARDKLDKLVNQGFQCGEAIPFEFASVIKKKMEEFSRTSSISEENRTRWRALSLGFNISVDSRIKERELQKERVQKKERTIFRKRT